jgi:tellurite resistance protein TerA
MGIDYTKRPASTPAQPSAAGPPPAGASTPGHSGGAAVSLSKVTLTKAAPSVSLTKHGGATGTLRVNLNWNARPPSHGLFRKTAQLDLDLGCLFEFSDGTKGVVQALGNSFRGYDRTGRELVRLDADDRSGASAEGENLYIDLRDPSAIRRILVFALIYEGAANWADAQGLATLLPVNAPPVEIQLDDPRDGARICAIAMLENRGGEILVNRLVNYINGAQRALDQAYGWGMNWTPGRK